MAKTATLAGTANQFETLKAVRSLIADEGVTLSFTESGGITTISVEKVKAEEPKPVSAPKRTTRRKTSK